MPTDQSEKPVKIPSPSHPITVEPSNTHVQVRFAGSVVADTRDALKLSEADYPPVLYVPLTDVDSSLLKSSEHATYCPFKGDASYYSIEANGETATDAVWEYREPHEAMAQLKGTVAFYADRVEAIEES